MTDDLVKRLRAPNVRMTWHEETAREAAARIEALEADNARLREAVDAMNCTAVLAHILEDGYIPDVHGDQIEAALGDQVAVLRALAHPTPADPPATPPAP